MSLKLKNTLKTSVSYTKSYRIAEKQYIVLGSEKEYGEIIKEILNTNFGRITFQKCTQNTLQKLTEDVTENCMTIIVADPEILNNDKINLKLKKTKGITVEYLPDMAEKHFKRIPTKLLLIFEDYYNAAFSKPKKTPAYRYLDLIISLLLIILTFPFLLFSMTYILVQDGRPIFFRQRRRGLRGNHFTLYKLRAYDDIVNESAEVENISTKSGYLLRKYRMNELPQLFNVIIGNMSLVGPRPDDENDYQQNIGPISYYIKRYNILPGITGYAQVCFQYCNTVDEFQQRLEYDLYYLKNRSIKFYLLTLLKTGKTILSGKGK